MIPIVVRALLLAALLLGARVAAAECSPKTTCPGGGWLQACVAISGSSCQQWFETSSGKLSCAACPCTTAETQKAASLCGSGAAFDAGGKKDSACKSPCGGRCCSATEQCCLSGPGSGLCAPMSASCCGAGYCASGNVCAEGSRCCPSDHPALHNGVCCPALAPSCGICPASDPVDCLESHGICCTSARQCCRVAGKSRCCSPGDSEGAPGYFPGAGAHPKAPQVAPSTTPPSTGEGCAPSSRQMGLGFGCNGDPGTPSSDGRREVSVPVTRDRGGSGGSPLCNSAEEGGTVVLECGAGLLIREVVFASYGTPSGSCGNYSLGSCHATGSVEHVSTACLNKPSCSVPATNAVFGDPCQSVTKRLFVEVRCGSALGRLEPEETSPWPLAPFGHGATQAAALFIIAVCATRRRRG